MIKLKGAISIRYGSGGSSYAGVSLTDIGGNNQMVYSSPGDGGYVIKILSDKFAGESPHSSWDAGKRADASADAYDAFPDIFPKAEKSILALLNRIIWIGPKPFEMNWRVAIIMEYMGYFQN